LPTVTALVAAYDYGAFLGRTLESALGQDYPPELLDVVVVDDGSTDDTLAVARRYEAAHPGRLTVISQPNAGYIAATGAALAAARGELLAVLDADDVWPRGRVRACAQALLAHPEAGLVYGDMTIIDAHDRVLHESLFERERRVPAGERALGALLGARGNCATASSIVMRASLRHAYEPIPDGIPYVDWWFACAVARHAALLFVPEPRVGYRFHGANLSLGTQGADLLREYRKALAFRRKVLAGLRPGELGIEEAQGAIAALDQAAALVAQAAGTPFCDLGAAQQEAAAERTAAGRAALAAGVAEDAAGCFAAAIALDPWAAGGREGLDAAVAAAALADARRHVGVADAAEICADPSLLRRWGERFGAGDDATLVIDATAMDAQAAARRLGAAVAAAGLDGPDAPDLLAIPGPAPRGLREALAARAATVLSADPDVVARYALKDPAAVAIQGPWPSA
jgi:hypothetical protein